jgi:Mce-associated membrane protein
MAAVRPHGLARALLRALPVVLLAGLIGLGVPLALRVSHRHAHDEDRSAVLAAGRAEITNLMNISYASAARDLGRVVAGATGDLRHQFEVQRAHASALAQTKSVLAGSVVSAGLLWLDEARQTARIVVAAAGTDGTAGSASTVRHYRWVLTLRHVGNRWLTADAALEGVPS